MQCTAILYPLVWQNHIQNLYDENTYKKCTRVTERNPEESSFPQHLTIEAAPSTNFFPGLRFFALGVAFCCPEAEKRLTSWPRVARVH